MTPPCKKPRALQCAGEIRTANLVDWAHPDRLPRIRHRALAIVPNEALRRFD